MAGDNPYVDLQPLIELEERLNPYSDDLFGVPLALGLAEGWWEEAPDG